MDLSAVSEGLDRIGAILSESLSGLLAQEGLAVLLEQALGTVMRFLLPVLALLVVIRCARSLLQGRLESETWGYLSDAGGQTMPLQHWEVLLGQLARHPELPRGLEELAAFSDMTDPDALDRTRRFKWRDGEVVVNFGKNSGRTLKDIAENDPGFLRWIIRSDFPDDVKTIAVNALSGRFPERG